MKLNKRVFAVVTAVLLLTGIFAIPVTAVSIDDFICDESATAVALELTGGGQVTSCKLSYNQGEAGYEIGITNGNMAYVVFIDAVSGEIMNFTRETLIETPAATSPETTPPATTTTPPVTTTTPSTTTATPPVTITPGNQQSYTAGSISASEAGSIALSLVGQGSLVRTETKHDHYKVCINIDNWHYDVHVHFNGNAFISKYREITYTDHNAYGVNTSTGVIGFDSAAQTALQGAGGSGVVIKNELHYKHREGILVYKVDVVVGQTEYKYELYASNGAVYKYSTKTWW